MIKIGIVGTGGMAAERARVLPHSGVTVTGICSRSADNAKTLCGETGAAAYDNYFEMLTNVDAVVICLPNKLHHRFALDAIEAGKHVLVEYPLAITYDQADQLRLAAQAAGTVLMVGNTIIHEAMFDYIEVNKARLGEIISASSRVALYDPNMTGSWYMSAENTGSVFTGMLYHHIEYYKHFLGKCEWILGKNQSIADTFVGGTILMGHQNQRTSCIQWYLACQGSGLPRGLWLNGTKSSVTIVSVKKDQSQVIWDEGGEDKCDTINDNWGITGSSKDFLKAITGKFEHKNRLDEDIDTLKIALAAEKSAHTGEIVNLP